MTTLNMPKSGAMATSVAPQGLEGYGLRHELVDAQVQVLCSYVEKRSPEQLVDALDRLIDCCRASFLEEEGLMGRLVGQIDPVHRERHQAVMDQLQQLRLSALNADRGRLLASLILIDRELIAHVTDAAPVQSFNTGATGTRQPPQVESQH